jgi:hypothetical protein
MIEPNRFDPFNNRLCRNVRNALSEGFKSALETKELQPVQKIAGFFLDEHQPASVRLYIENRLAAYERVLAMVLDNHLEQPLTIAMVIWDQGLFFETHEYLETFWMEAAGEERALLQALIRAAGTYVHLEQGNLIAARRISDKAIPILEEKQTLLTGSADVKLLLCKLKSLDPDPPKLSPKKGS